MENQKSYSYSDYKAWQRVNAVLGISIDEAELTAKGDSSAEPKAKNTISADTKSYLQNMKSPDSGTQGKKLSI